MDRDHDRERITERVRALLTKADRTDNPHEREAFWAKAQALITRYQIAEAELSETPQTMGNESVLVEGWGNATRGVVLLYGNVAELNRCSTGHRITRGSARIVIFGADIDRELTQTLIDHLLPQLRADLLRDRPRSRMSYAMGWAAQVQRRLAEAQQAEAAQSKALVPTNVAANDALHEAYNIRSGRSTEVDARAYGSGLEAAENVDIGQTKLTASRH